MKNEILDNFLLHDSMIIDMRSSPQRIAMFNNDSDAAKAYRSLLASDGIDPEDLRWKDLPSGTEVAQIVAEQQDAQLRLLNYAEVAELLGGVSTQKVRNLVKDGQLPIVVLGEKTHRVRLSDVKSFIARGGMGVS